jgi:hypothetical protein
MLTSDTISAIMPAFIKAQGNFAPALKSSTNPHFKSKYVALDGVIDAVAEPLRAEGIAIVQMTDVEGAGTILVTRLIHASGEWIGSRYPVHPVKADPQGEGSALTYARRYALMALVGIAPEDDDGNAAVKGVEKSAADDQAKAANFKTAIAGASDDAELARVAADLAGSGLPPALLSNLRALYSSKKKELAA